MLYTIEQVLPDAIGRALPININGAIPAILLDLGLPITTLKGIAILGPHCRADRPFGRGSQPSHRLHHVGGGAKAIQFDGQS